MGLGISDISIMDTEEGASVPERMYAVGDRHPRGKSLTTLLP